MCRPTRRRITSIFAAVLLGLTVGSAEAAAYARFERVAGPSLSPRDMAVILISGAALALLVVVWRRPGGPDRDASGARPRASSRGIVSIPCGRCGRVVDLPRDRALSRVFCPRCGGLMHDE